MSKPKVRRLWVELNFGDLGGYLYELYPAKNSGVQLGEFCPEEWERITGVRLERGEGCYVRMTFEMVKK